MTVITPFSEAFSTACFKFFHAVSATLISGIEPKVFASFGSEERPFLSVSWTVYFWGS